MISKRLGIVVGTRPDIIKLSPIIRYCKKNNINHSLIHTGQHYNPEMDSIFFSDLNLPKPDINIKSGYSLKRNKSLDQTAEIMNKLKKVFIEEKVGLVIVLGDTNSAMAASIIARRLNLKLAHVEAGLRSFDDQMQEEHNRVMIDHIADFNFSPTRNAINNLKKEGIPAKKIFLTGNTIVDAVYQNFKIAINKRKGIIFEKEGIKGTYILVTSHRPENVDHKDRLKSIIEGIKNIKQNYPQCLMIFSIHPRTKKRIEEFDIKPTVGIKFIDPHGYLDFLLLEAGASLIITDSGGVQEEACILKRPCVTIREYTERPETLKIGCNVLAGVKSDNIVKCATNMLNKKIKYKNPFGDGKSAAYIMRILKGKMQ